MLLKRRRRLVKRAARVRHVVDEDGDLVPDVADEHHAADDVGPRALLVDQGEGHVEAVGHGRGALGAPGVRGDDDEVVDVEVLADPLEDGRLGVQVVDGHAEEALDLRGVEIDGDDMVLFLKALSG